MCGKGAIAELAHACEDLIGRPGPGNVGPPVDALALLFEAEAQMRSALAAHDADAGYDDRMSALLDKLRGATAQKAAATSLVKDAPAAPDLATSSMSGELPLDVSSTQDLPAGAEAPHDGVIPDAAGAQEAVIAGAAELHDVGPQPVSLDKPQLLERPVLPPRHNQSNRVAVDLEKVEALVAKVTEIVANRTASHGLVETLANTVNEMTRAVHRLQAIAIGLQYQISSHGYDTVPEQEADGLDLEAYGPLRQLLLQLQEAAADQQALVGGVHDLVARKRALAAVETRLDTELQGALLNMRLLPLSQLRVRLDQVVRTAAAATRREVRWTMEGHDVALDKYVCDRLFEPLMHLLRNCVDHGIEAPSEREAAGKPRVGRIMVRASVEGNQAVVIVSDDGRGIDPENIAQVAVARGLIDADRAASLSTREKLELVFRPGFTTAQVVTELSGRGMGMEIVREACTRMGGTVSIGRRENGGTVVVLCVPLSMSVVHCIVVRDAGRYLAIPATQVSFVQLVPPTAMSRRRRDGYHVRIGTSVLRLFFLPPGQQAAGSPTSEFEERTVLVVPYRGERVALAVDEIVEEEDQVIKPLPLILQKVDRLLGAVILGDGTPAPVLNLVPLLDQISLPGAEPVDAKVESPDETVVLVVDDSLTMRLALTRTLEHAGFTVETARDGQDALEHVRTHGLPHLVTLDIEMPRMDGLETLYALRHLPGGEQVPIFMLSSRSGRKHLRTADKMGATRYFTKPYHDSEFVAAVRDVTTRVASVR
jgi:chemosensory pili system protein ChpA (sensor histidine kinase/response regulator)